MVEQVIFDEELAAKVQAHPLAGKRAKQVIMSFVGSGKLRDVPHERRLEFLRALDAAAGIAISENVKLDNKPDCQPTDKTPIPVRLTTGQDNLLINNGYQPVPVCGKAPKLHQWDKDVITPERIAEWRASKPDHVSTGVRTGNADDADPKNGTLFVSDLDLTDQNGLVAAENLAMEIFGTTPLRRVGRKGCALFYRKHGKPAKKQTIFLGGKGQVELFGRGQVVIFGEHAETRKPYQWTGQGTPLTVPFIELPGITDTQVQEYARRLREMVDAPRKTELPQRDAASSYNKNKPITVAALLDKLACIDPTMKGRFSQWIGIAKFLWHGECPLVAGEATPDWHTIVDDWCRGDLWRKRTGDENFIVTTYPGNFDALAKLISGNPRIEGTRTTLGTIVKLAKDGKHTGPISVASGATIEGYFEIGSDIEIAQKLVTDLKQEFGGDIVFAEGNFYHYDGKRWAAISESDLRRRVHRYDGWSYGIRGVVRLSKFRVNSVLNETGAMLDQKDFFDQAPVGINAANGFIRFGTDGTPELVPHHPEQRSRHVLQFAWEPPVVWFDGHLLWSLLDRSFHGDLDVQQRLSLIGELFGAAALGIATELKEPKAIVLHGRSAENGKSQLLDAMRGLLPSDSVKAIPPTDFGDDRKVIHLVGAHLNAVDELGSAEAISSDAFKSLVTGEPRRAREVYRSSVEFRSRALHVFATNSLPSFGGGFDRGVQRRLLVLPFNRSIPKDEKIANLGMRIVAEEGDALLAFAVEGASRLLRQGQFTEPPSCRVALRDWLYGADPVIAWLDSCTEYAQGVRTQKKDAYEEFQRWAGEEGFNRHHLPSINNFVQRVLAQDGRISSVRNKEGRLFVALRLLSVFFLLFTVGVLWSYT